MATWNRSNIIGFAIESVLRQTFTDWELLVVGDHCTDDTEAVVTQYYDPRISFINLPENFGEQSRPNNVGIERSSGEYCAFLNHDDFWFDDHLERCLAILEKSEADMAVGSMLLLNPDAPPGICAVSQSGYYDAKVDYPASSWVFKRSLWHSIGPFKPAVQLYSYPTYEWIWRAARAGSKIVSTQHFTVLKIHSIARKKTYKDRLREDHLHCHQQLTKTSDFRERLLAEYCADNSATLYSIGRLCIKFFKQFIRNSSYAIFAACGIAPLAAKNFLRYGRKGGFLNDLRRRRGLDRLIQEKAKSNE